MRERRSGGCLLRSGFVVPLCGTKNLARSNASRAEVSGLRDSVDHSLHALKIRNPTRAGVNIGMGDKVSRGRFFAT